jgi:hypothetical protein
LQVLLLPVVTMANEVQFVVVKHRRAHWTYLPPDPTMLVTVAIRFVAPKSVFGLLLSLE